ncbi:DUF4476 domain-containing protein [Chitinophaga pendula]|uniref:DUF4476 domain-containing protein n=1 Tax=Chitinophaga TaxID=79328 RepID=UPI000BB0953D|nr:MULTISPECIES: DUF4476 domain-containing protein [Chitinophaga]ASZ10972.1 hypothetical protein CK934_08285 [Chitinophaga sp. MD30]UCJ06038.1 DUF4476 domain-containing protein [Chitinophaga pendula]
MGRYFKRIIYALSLLGFITSLQAQDQQYYVYIQNEKPQPFYVKYNGKLLSSSDRGYIILSKLDAGTTPITVGFPKNESPEQEFKIRLAGKNDQGYLLKADGDKGYALYNLQTFRVTKNNTETPQETAATDNTPAPATEEDTAKKAMMASLQKDLETSFNDKAQVNGPHKTTTDTAPAKKSDNPFSAALDKVVSDDRPSDIPAAQPVTTAPVAGTVVEPPSTEGEGSSRKSKKKRKEKEPLTAEEKAILGDVIAEEHKEAAAAAVTTGDPANTTTAEEPARKSRKAKKKNGNPEFIEFGEEAAKTPTVPDAAPAAGTLPVTTAITSAGDNNTVVKSSSKKDRKRKKVSEYLGEPEHPNNIITDSSGYGVGVQPERLTWKERRKKEREAARQQDASAGTNLPAGTITPATTPAESDTPKENDKKNSALKMVNSDCANVMDDAAYRKVLRRFVAAKDDDGMIDAFRKNTKNYCLETAQIKSLVQLLSTDENRYKLLDLAYPKAYDSEQFSSLSSLLTDSYYQNRFKAMVKK